MVRSSLGHLLVYEKSVNWIIDYAHFDQNHTTHIFVPFEIWFLSKLPGSVDKSTQLNHCYRASQIPIEARNRLATLHFMTYICAFDESDRVFIWPPLRMLNDRHQTQIYAINVRKSSAAVGRLICCCGQRTNATRRRCRVCRMAARINVWVCACVPKAPKRARPIERYALSRTRVQYALRHSIAVRACVFGNTDKYYLHAAALACVFALDGAQEYRSQEKFNVARGRRRTTYLSSLQYNVHGARDRERLSDGACTEYTRNKKITINVKSLSLRTT